MRYIIGMNNFVPLRIISCSLRIQPAERIIAFQGLGGLHADLPRSLQSELLAALGSAPGQDLAAVAGGHSLPEAVDLGPLTLLGLVGSERGHALHLLSVIVRWHTEHRRYTRRRQKPPQYSICIA